MTDMEQHQRERLEGLVAKTVARLHDLAQRVEMEARRGISNAAEGRQKWSTYGRAVGQIEHEVSWGVANLTLSQLMEVAADCDLARAEKRNGGTL